MSVCIAGVGIHPFGRTPARSGRDQGVFAVRQALADAGIGWRDVGAAYGGSVSAGAADIMVNELGLTGLPFTNVANGCATGGSALAAARAAIASGEHEIVLAVGFDKHQPGAFDPKPAEWGLPDWYGETGFMLTTQFFALKLRRYMDLYSIQATALGRVAEKSYRNGALADHAWRRAPIAIDAIMGAAMINDPLTKYMFCSPAEGGAAIILTSERKARELGITAIRLKSVAMRSRPRGSFEVFAAALDIERGVSPTVLAASAAFEAAGIGPGDIDLAQLQDTDSGAEIMHMAENGFCGDGEQSALLEAGATGIGGRLPINTDGGCIACGEPIGASGLRQVYENVVQLRGRAAARQVPGSPKTAYSQVYGAPGVAAVAILER